MSLKDLIPKDLIPPTLDKDIKKKQEQEEPQPVKMADEWGAISGVLNISNKLLSKFKNLGTNLSDLASELKENGYKAKIEEDGDDGYEVELHDKDDELINYTTVKNEDQIEEWTKMEMNKHMEELNPQTDLDIFDQAISELNEAQEKVVTANEDFKIKAEAVFAKLSEHREQKAALDLTQKQELGQKIGGPKL
jgi:fructose-specific phosphotransferase system component IIB